MKKNNRGFSLVEVIAVIAILGILSGITITAVTRLTTSSRKKTYKNFEDNLKKATNNYLVSHNELAEEENLKLDAQTLIDEGFLEAMVDPIDKKENCNKDSYVIVTGKRENNTDYNISYSYDICLVCPSYTSSKCPTKTPGGEVKPSCPIVNVNVTYDHSSLTNQDVVAKLNIPNSKIKIKNNGGKDTYTFKENGKFEFKYIDEENNCEGTATATVNWIDKVAPSATIKYSHNEKTNKPVIAVLTKETEPITIINNDGKNNYVFQENGTFEFVYKDQAGNIGKTLATVDWIENSSAENPGQTPNTPPDTTPEPNNPVSPGNDSNTSESDKREPTNPNNSKDDNSKPEDKKDDEKQQKKKKSHLPLIFEIIVLIILAFLFFFFKRKSQERDNYID